MHRIIDQHFRFLSLPEQVPVKLDGMLFPQHQPTGGILADAQHPV